MTDSYNPVIINQRRFLGYSCSEIKERREIPTLIIIHIFPKVIKDYEKIIQRKEVQR